MCNLVNTHTHSICHFSPLIFALNSPALHHVPSGSKLRRFGGVGVGFYHSWWRSCRAGLPTPVEVAHDPTVCQYQTYLGHDPLRQAHLPIREVGLGLTSSSSIKGAAYIGCHALVLGHVVAASARGNLPPLLERLPERPMASALIEELKIVATEAKRT